MEEIHKKMQTLSVIILYVCIESLSNSVLVLLPGNPRTSWIQNSLPNSRLSDMCCLKLGKYTTASLFLNITSMNRVDILPSEMVAAHFHPQLRNTKILIQTDPRIHFLQTSNISFKFLERLCSRIHFFFNAAALTESLRCLPWNIPQLVAKFFFRGLKTSGFSLWRKLQSQMQFLHLGNEH